MIPEAHNICAVHRANVVLLASLMNTVLAAFYVQTHKMPLLQDSRWEIWTLQVDCNYADSNGPS